MLQLLRESHTIRLLAALAIGLLLFFGLSYVARATDHGSALVGGLIAIGCSMAVRAIYRSFRS